MIVRPEVDRCACCLAEVGHGLAICRWRATIEAVWFVGACSVPARRDWPVRCSWVVRCSFAPRIRASTVGLTNGSSGDGGQLLTVSGRLGCSRVFCVAQGPAWLVPAVPLNRSVRPEVDRCACCLAEVGRGLAVRRRRATIEAVWFVGSCSIPARRDWPVRRHWVVRCLFASPFGRPALV